MSLGQDLPVSGLGYHARLIPEIYCRKAQEAVLHRPGLTTQYLDCCGAYLQELGPMILYEYITLRYYGMRGPHECDRHQFIISKERRENICHNQ